VCANLWHPWTVAVGSLQRGCFPASMRDVSICRARFVVICSTCEARRVLNSHFVVDAVIQASLGIAYSAESAYAPASSWKLPGACMIGDKNSLIFDDELMKSLYRPRSRNVSLGAKRRRHANPPQRKSASLSSLLIIP